MNQRQTKRRKHFEFLLAQMPFWETWTTEHVATETIAVINMTENGREVTYEERDTVVKRGHAKLIPRRVRRDMARKRMQREMRVAPQ